MQSIQTSSYTNEPIAAARQDTEYVREEAANVTARLLAGTKMSAPVLARFTAIGNIRRCDHPSHYKLLM